MSLQKCEVETVFYEIMVIIFDTIKREEKNEKKFTGEI